MATWTAAQLATAVLRRLGVTGAGQTASAEDSAVVTDAWTSLHPYLRRHSLAQFGAGAIEEACQEPLAKWVAGQVYQHWGFTETEAQILRAADEGWRQLREAQSADRTPLPGRAKYL